MNKKLYGGIFMPVALDITNQIFGKLTAIKRVPSRGGKTYWLCRCECGQEKEVQTCHLISGATQSCGCLTKNSKKETHCLNCGKELNKKQFKYCSLKCQRSYERKQYVQKVNEGLCNGTKKSGDTTKISDSIRSYLFQKYNNKCQLCGWGISHPITGKVPLEVHHKDGDRNNNKEENLQLLCPNCHSLTENYKYLNSKKYKKE